MLIAGKGVRHFTIIEKPARGATTHFSERIASMFVTTVLQSNIRRQRAPLESSARWYRTGQRMARKGLRQDTYGGRNELEQGDGHRELGRGSRGSIYAEWRSG